MGAFPEANIAKVLSQVITKSVAYTFLEGLGGWFGFLIRAESDSMLSAFVTNGNHLSR